MHKSNTTKITLAAMFTSLCLLFPFLTLQNPALGSVLCLMHIPVLICGYVLGPVWGTVVGAVSPILRSALFGSPVMFPMAVGMAFELAAYGAATGFARRIILGGSCGGENFSVKKAAAFYGSLIAALCLGRMVYALFKIVLMYSGGDVFFIGAYVTGTVASAIPGIVLQLIIVPPAVTVIEKILKNEKS